MALCWEYVMAFLENSLRVLVHGSLMDGWAEKGNNGLEIRTFDRFDHDSQDPGLEDSDGAAGRGQEDLQNQEAEVHNPDLQSLAETCGAGAEENLRSFH